MSLPFVVVAIWIVFVVLAGFERNQLIEQLHARVSHGSVEEATLAVRQLASLSNPPLVPFVSAAASPSGIVAREAQLAIDDLLRRWQGQLKAGRDVDRVADRLHRLAATLDQNRFTFSTRDYPWLARTATKIVRLSNNATQEEAPMVAMYCESMLAIVNTPIISVPRPVSLRVSELMSPLPIISYDGGATRAEPSLAAGTPQIVVPDFAGEPIAGIIDSDAAIVGTPIDSSAAEIEQDTMFSLPTRDALQAILATGDRQPHDDYAKDAPQTVTPTDSSTAWYGQWLRPLIGNFGGLPVSPPLGDGQLLIDATAPTTALVESPPIDVTFASDDSFLQSRALLNRWLTADTVAATSIERELAERGFGTMSPELVQQFFSEVVDDRVQLVHDVIITPGLDAKPWLKLLADDASAEVRLAAVSVMATSSDPDLVEKAWYVALHDRDPRIAGIAERLRERRASGLRR